MLSNCTGAASEHRDYVNTTMCRPLQYPVRTIQEALDRLSDLHQEFRGDPSALRSTLETELSEEVFEWALSPNELVLEQAFWATTAWIALSAYRFWVLKRSSHETVNLLGPELVIRYLAEAERLEQVALLTGDWAWAVERLREWLHQELS